MEPEKFTRKYEQLERAYGRIQRLYNGQIMNEEGEDSFHSPKDVVRNFFQICYELKESLRFDPNSPTHLSANKWALVEQFCNSDFYVSLSMDIANQEKHIILHKPKTNKKIWEINTGIHILSPTNRTELTIEIDGKKEDCLRLTSNILASWRKFWSDNSL
jgi:hypothetical protein